jgi:hypothetical protein
MPATSEDDLAKKDIQDAVWNMAGKGAGLGAVGLLCFFAAWWMWGYGPQGAPALREQIVKTEAQLLEFKNKRVDLEGKLTVAEGRLSQCQSELAKARAAGGAAATP